MKGAESAETEVPCGTIAVVFLVFWCHSGASVSLDVLAHHI